MKKIPSTFTIVFFLILIAAVCTWFIPGGEYVRRTVAVETADGTAMREVIDGDSFHYVDRAPQTWQVFTAFFNGFVDKADIIIFILIVGGAFFILNSSHAIDVGVLAFLGKIQRLNRYGWIRKLGVENIIMTLIMIMFSLFGAVFGMSEETIAFVVVFIPLAISMGYDSLVGLCLCYVAAHVGFAGAMLNPFTIGIAQGIAQIPIFSGLGYRVFCWGVLTVVCVVFMLLYAGRVKRQPEFSPVYQLDQYWRDRVAQQKAEQVAYVSPRSAWVVYGVMCVVLAVLSVCFPTTVISIGHASTRLCLVPVWSVLFVVSGFFLLRKSVHFFIIDILLFTIAFLVTGVLGYGWYIREISALFFAMGLLCGLACGTRADDLAKLFMDGCKDILSAALIVGLASGIIFILQDGHVIDTILHGLTASLSQTGALASVGVMYVFQTLLNVIMPSGSAKAALTMPIMSQFADLIGVSRQTAVLAFQFGDGFTNMITPTSGVMIGCLGVARIPYSVWFKWAWKAIVALVVLGFVLLVPTLYLQLSGF